MNRKDLAWFVRTLVVLLLPLIIAYLVGLFQPTMLIGGSGEGVGGAENVGSEVKPAWIFGAFIELAWIMICPFIFLREKPEGKAEE
jgi:hypothetical protein